MVIVSLGLPWPQGEAGHIQTLGGEPGLTGIQSLAACVTVSSYFLTAFLLASTVEGKAGSRCPPIPAALGFQEGPGSSTSCFIPALANTQA